ncbi:hypothetical protein RJ640_001429 [Escallonia rubra]|uniref:Bet v I/Major latex protein domain-containing protein n=1 Tax=Escallonia rubra TaxID=112253 RepID=A0AA88RFX4_9ASTE|nr:hypothetical protein RJ640_001429 [Escallonia rubra]
MVDEAYDIELKYSRFVLDGDNLFPKIMPAAIKGVENVEGDRGVGRIKLVTFGEGTIQLKNKKHQIYGLDKENFTYSYSLIEIECDALMGDLESITYLRTYLLLTEDPFAYIKAYIILKATLKSHDSKESPA